VSDDEKEPNTYCLSAYYEPIVQKLLETTDRFVMFSVFSLIMLLIAHFVLVNCVSY